MTIEAGVVPRATASRPAYAERARTWEAEAERQAARSRLVSNLRGLSFAVATVSFIALLAGGPAGVCVPLAVVGLSAFIALVVLHARVLDAQDLAERWVDVNRAALARSSHDFASIPDTGEGLAPPDHPYAADLDLFGRASLFQRLSVARTRVGRERLAELLLEPASTESVRERQRTVRALAADLDLRQRFEAHALGVAGAKPGTTRVRSAPNPELLFKWAESEPSLVHDAVSVWCSRILPPFTLASLVGYFAFGTTGIAPLVGLAAQAILLVRTARETSLAFSAVSASEGAFLRYGTLLEIIETLDTTDPLLVGLRDRLRTSEGMPSATMRRFRTIVGWFDLRHNGLVHPFANLLLLWDIHCTLALERWQLRAGKRLREWFDVIGWFEALSSLASFA
ncbi:MAG TPA: hypothetical protein VKY73_09460, partial [Polyangiaceae bacterium]|nr:hypothetical protein [Polyangiaceae bacterium]